MKLSPIKANMTELEINGMRILFSYKTPVAMRLLTPEGMEDHVTSKYWSRTTSRHINAWLPRGCRIEHPQEFFDSLLAGVK